MKNPFISVSDNDNSEYVTSRCSLNRAVLAKLPLYGMDDAIEGLMFKDIFSTPLVVAEISRIARRYSLDISDIPDSKLPFILDEGLSSSGDMRCRQLAQQVVKKFGTRLGLILLTLRMGEEENRLARPDWDDACWDYWGQLDTIILTGGLASSMLGRRFKEYIHNTFDIAGVKPYNVMLFENGSYLGMMGVAQRLMEDNSAALVLDMGHTGWKRALVRKATGEITGFTPMESMPSPCMENDLSDEGGRLRLAGELHRRIVNFIASSYRELSQSAELSDSVLISIANYTHGGYLDEIHGGYSKLRLLGSNYVRVLEEELSSELHREIRVRLVHDGTATALYFSDVDNSACVTLGTGFGIGFPEIQIV